MPSPLKKTHKRATKKEPNLMKKIFKKWKNYTSWKQKERTLYPKAYKFYYSWLLKKVKLAIDYEKLAPRKLFLFFIWKKQYNESSQASLKQSSSIRETYLKSQVTHGWMKWVNQRKKKKGISESTLAFYKEKLMQKSFDSLKLLRLQKIRYQNFIIKRIRKFLKRSISHWRSIKNIKDLKKYNWYKAEEFNDSQIMKKGIFMWKEMMQRNALERKITLFWKYWKRVFKKTKTDIEKYTIGCRKRHLLSFYFNKLKRNANLNKQKKKAILFQLKVLLRSWRILVFHKSTKKNGLKLASAFCAANYHKELKRKVFEAILIFSNKFFAKQKNQKKALNFYQSFIQRNLLKSILKEWYRIPLINMVDKHRQNKVKKSCFFKILKYSCYTIKIEESIRKNRKLKLLSTCFKALKTYLIPKILSHKKANNFRSKQLLVKMVHSWLNYLCQKYSKHDLKHNEIYAAKLLHKSLIGFKINTILSQDKSELQKKLKWFLFENKINFLKKIFRSWKILHRTRIILFSACCEIKFRYLHRWKCSSKLQSLKFL
ncbi:unnamed protein product [Blepharisma stoltei]|uniref:Uncharacterized protein n=1 Tax=Blepharisma stoltei TaxID=1481888 RepID=A0AAU9JYC2_9CILI|nr:unnamed protein product [Blepharisma stoltei]